MAENELIAAVEAYLSSVALAPAPATLGVGEPGDGASLPAVVISLEDTHHVHPGIGERTTLMVGALPWTATIDLANPVLPEDPSFALLDGARLTLILPHGGQVKQDGSNLPLTAADISITVAGSGLTFTTSAPTGNQFSIDPTIGTVTFGSALPATGQLVATYYLGQWEQRLAHIAGTLRVDVCALLVNDARAIAEAIVTALEAPAARTAILGLNLLAVSGVSSVGAPDPLFASSRRRSLRFAFDYEAEINRPDSSGGVIKQIPLRGPTTPPPPAIPKDSELLS